MNKFTFILLATACVACGQKSKTTQATIEGAWIEPNPIDSTASQGIEIKADGKAASINMHTLTWKSWKQQGDTLFLTGISEGSGEAFEFTDTTLIKRLTADSLVLSNGKSYTRK